MPIILGKMDGVPQQYYGIMDNLYSIIESRWINHIGYLTIDEQKLKKGESLRRAGLHVDGIYNNKGGPWAGGGGWGTVGTGMFVISNTPHCKAYLGYFSGKPKKEGECEHLKLPNKGEILKKNEIYWLDGLCVHESLPVKRKLKRQWLRLSMPSNAPWFEGYTENPTGILPTGKILSKRKFMKV